jgi:hypothetical protein
MDWIILGGHIVSLKDKECRTTDPERKNLFFAVKRIQEKFSKRRVKTITKRLKYFCPYAIVAFAEILFLAQEKGKRAQEVLREIGKEDKNNWSRQEDFIRGDPNLPGNFGRENRTSINNIRAALGLPLLEFDKSTDIPVGPFSFEDPYGNIKHFGPRDQNGIRRITFKASNGGYKIDEPVKILKLIAGENVVVHYINQNDYASFPVKSITL